MSSRSYPESRKPKAKEFIKLQSFTCDHCGNPFEAYPSDRPRENKYCHPSCAAKKREADLGHGSVTLECGYCGEPVTKPQSQLKSENVFCNRAHYLAWRHGKTLVEE